MIAQCEADEMDGKNMASNKIKGPKVRTINSSFLFRDENSGYLQTFCVLFKLCFCHGFFVQRTDSKVVVRVK